MEIDMSAPRENVATENEAPWAIISAFSEELTELNRVLAQHGPTNFVARLYIRSLFSMLDGYAYYVKHRALSGAERARIQLEERDIDIILEQRRKKNRDGSEQVVPKIVPTRQNLAYALKLYARVRGAEPPLVNGSLPRDFDIAAEARNRITHPKRRRDFELSQAEREAVARLLGWFKGVMDWVKDEELKNIREISDESNQMFDQARQFILQHRTQQEAATNDDAARGTMSLEELYTAPILNREPHK
jgi:hypothetical protein